MDDLQQKFEDFGKQAFFISYFAVRLEIGS
jgi:hypothetical protein